MIPRTSDVIHVALALYDPKGTYSRHAGVVMTSMFERTHSRVLVHILHDDTLTADNRERFERTARRFGQGVCFVDVSERLVELRHRMDIDVFAGRFSRGALFRLFIPDLLNDEKMIYLDCDVAVNLDIAEFWNIDVADVSLAVIPESLFSWKRSFYEKLRSRIMQYDSRLYFNSGVLLMNLARIRRNYDLLNELDKFVRRYGYCAAWPDQDFLNVIFRDDFLTVNGKFDRIDENHNIDDSIWHLCGPNKSFVLPLCKPKDYFYWEVFNRSEWRDQIVYAMLEMYKNSVHVRTSSCWRRAFKQLTLDIFRTPLKCYSIVKLCVLELRHRIMGA